MVENIEYRCFAACKHNGGKGNAAYPCHLKNKGLKPNKDTVQCFGNRCSFYEPKEEG